MTSVLNLADFVSQSVHHVQRNTCAPVILQNFTELGLKAIKMDILAKKFRSMADDADLPDSVRSQLFKDAEYSELMMHEILAVMDRVIDQLAANQTQHLCSTLEAAL